MKTVPYMTMPRKATADSVVFRWLAGKLTMFQLGSATNEVLAGLYTRMIPMDLTRGTDVYCVRAPLDPLKFVLDRAFS